MVAVTLFVIGTWIDKDISFGSQEMNGDRFQRPLEQLLDLLPRHQSVARKVLAGDADAKNQLSSVEQEIDEAFGAPDLHPRLCGRASSVGLRQFPPWPS